MDKNKSNTIQYLLIILLGLIISVMLFYIMMRSKLNTDIEFVPDMTITDNPLMGYAPDAANIDLCEKTRENFHSVFIQ